MKAPENLRGEMYFRGDHMPQQLADLNPRGSWQRGYKAGWRTGFWQAFCGWMLVLLVAIMLFVTGCTPAQKGRGKAGLQCLARCGARCASQCVIECAPQCVPAQR